MTSSWNFKERWLYVRRTAPRTMALSKHSETTCGGKCAVQSRLSRHTSVFKYLPSASILQVLVESEMKLVVQMVNPILLIFSEAPIVKDVKNNGGQKTPMDNAKDARHGHFEGANFGEIALAPLTGRQEYPL